MGDRDVHPKSSHLAVSPSFLIYEVMEEEMEKKCNNCGMQPEVADVPFVVYQATAARQERQIRRMWIVILLLICALIGTNLSWIIYNSQFEVVEETIETNVAQENDNGDNNYIGNDGDITYGEAEDND
jgi:hypothetical protein